jgi:hypothetical protein
MGGPVSLSVTGVTPSSAMHYENSGVSPAQLYWADTPGIASIPGETVITVNPGDTWDGSATDGGFVPGVREYLNASTPGPGIAHVVVTVFG